MRAPPVTQTFYIIFSELLESCFVISIVVLYARLFMIYFNVCIITVPYSVIWFVMLRLYGIVRFVLQLFIILLNVIGASVLLCPILVLM